MAGYAPDGARRQNAIGLAVVAVVVVGGMWAANSGAVDFEAVLWSKPGRVWAVSAGLGVFLAGFWAVTVGVKRRGGELRIAPLLAAAVLAGGVAYGLDLRGRVMPASADPACTKGQSVNLDGVCAPAKKETTR